MANRHDLLPFSEKSLRSQFKHNLQGLHERVHGFLRFSQPEMEILSRLRRLISKHYYIAGAHPVSIRLPSVMALSGSFGCSQMNILEALNALRQEGYLYRLLALDAPLQLEQGLAPPSRQTMPVSSK